MLIFPFSSIVTLLVNFAAFAGTFLGSSCAKAISLPFKIYKLDIKKTIIKNKIKITLKRKADKATFFILVQKLLGALLSFLGIYEKLIKIGGAGATILISNFGHLLYQGGFIGFHEYGVIGFFSGLLVKSSAAIVAAVVFSFIFALIFKPKN